jgi:hypothetical protein
MEKFTQQAYLRLVTAKDTDEPPRGKRETPGIRLNYMKNPCTVNSPYRNGE